MKKLSFLLKVGLILTVLLASTLPAQAEAEKTEFTGSSVLMGLIDPGVETNPDGNIHVRGLTLLYFDDLSDPRVSGLDTVVVNYNMRTVSPPSLSQAPCGARCILRMKVGTGMAHGPGSVMKRALPTFRVLLTDMVVMKA